MARTIRANKERSAQSWTRCRVPVGRQIPYLSESLDVPAGWLTPLEGLVKSPGFDYSVCLRNIHDAEDTIFVFGFQDASTPGAFFSVNPAISIWDLSEKVTMFTYSFTYPVPEENRDILYRLGGLEINPEFTTSKFGPRPSRGWIREPQTGEHGQLVEKGMILQSWPDTGQELVPDIQEAVSKDEWAREILRHQIEKISPLGMEETIWTPCEEIMEDVETEERTHDEDRMDVDDVEDVDSDGA
ncbi:hypothetical protein CJF31_00007497 [Rutstroemia sp. NJR-2017a BVV2]|nr:hypothetical protein CJF31_00007497 [Rutstroemia sp. NJR-2017a BVV2]